MKAVCLILLLTSVFSVTSSSNILAIFTLASPSHYIWVRPLMTTLARRGHRLTVLSPHTESPPVPNMTSLLIEDVYKTVGDTYDYESMSELSMVYWIKETFVFFEMMCTYTLRSDGFKQLTEYPKDTRFDVLITDAIGSECLLGVRKRFGNPPIVVVNSLSNAPWVFDITGTPTTPSHIPFYYSPFSDRMSFAERTYNFLANAYSYIYYKWEYLPRMDKESRQFFGSGIESAQEVIQNASVALLNVHPAVSYPWPTTPNLIPVAGMQIRDPKPLPAELQEFLDGAREGAVLLSLGTNVRSDRLSPAKRAAILGALGALPQRVLWKFESPLPDPPPPNVLVSKFLPQGDVLAHPNVRVFVSHAGLLSTHEAVWRGVPVVGVPFLVDQHANIRRLARHGAAVLLEYQHLTRHTLRDAVQEVLTNRSYRENMARLSSRFRDSPEKPLERAVFWTEYALRHGGAPHLRSAAKDLSLAQYYLLDVLAALLAAPLLLAVLLCKLCARRKSTKATKQKQN